MAHAQKPDFFFLRNGRVHLNRQGTSVHSTTGRRVVRISSSSAGYIMFWGSVKSTGYPLHSPVSPSLSLPWVTVCHHISVGVYYMKQSSVWHPSRFIYSFNCVGSPACVTALQDPRQEERYRSKTGSRTFITRLSNPWPSQCSDWGTQYETTSRVLLMLDNDQLDTYLLYFTIRLL